MGIILNFILDWQRLNKLDKPDYLSFSQIDEVSSHGSFMSIKTGIEKLKEVNFSRLNSIELVAGNTNNWQWRAYLFISKIELRIAFLVDESNKALTVHSTESLAKKIYDIVKFKCGYYFSWLYAHGPIEYVSGSLKYTIGYKQLPVTQENAISKWSHEIAESFKQGVPLINNIRDVYFINFLSDQQLRLEINGKTLREWINKGLGHGKLNLLAEPGGPWVWVVPYFTRSLIKFYLGRKGLLVSWGDFGTKSGGLLGATYENVPHIPYWDIGTDDINLQSSLTLYEFGSDEDHNWRVNCATKFIQLKAKYAPPEFINRQDTSRILDLVLSNWLQDKNSKKQSALIVSNALAVIFGDILQSKLKMQWKVYKTEDGNARYILKHALSNTHLNICNLVRLGISTHKENYFKELQRSLQKPNQLG